MKTNLYVELLKGGDLRSIGNVNKVLQQVETQSDFDNLFIALYHRDRKVIMRTADAIEKITLTKPEYLQKHKSAIIKLCQTASDIELKWHLALIVTRMHCTGHEIKCIWQILRQWALDSNESKIVRVNSLQGLFKLLTQAQNVQHEFQAIISQIKAENISSLNARIRKLER